MESEPFPKKTRLDFSRPTFNEPIINLPQSRTMSKVSERIPSSFADDEEESSRESDNFVAPKPKTTKQTESVNVYLRLRPAEHKTQKFQFDHKRVIVSQSNKQEKHFEFSSVFDEHVDQVQIYDTIVRPVLSDCFEVSGATFASYGVSNSGKTYTILGDNNFSGLVPRALTQLFIELEDAISEFPFIKICNDKVILLDDKDIDEEMANVKDFLSESRKMHKNKNIQLYGEHINKEHNFAKKEVPENSLSKIYIWLSFVEIYNENIIDLLNCKKDGNRDTLKIFSNKGNSFIFNVTWLYAATLQEALEILQNGLNRISYASTGINNHSSRSHSIFTMYVIEDGIDVKFSSFKFCDLAGAERTKKTGNVGVRLKEAGGINNSLLVLSRCLEAVLNNQKKGIKSDALVPVRDSKLTFLLQNSLLGREKFAMIVNLYPTEEFYEENLNVLKYGSITNQIVFKKSEARKFARNSSRFSVLAAHNHVKMSPIKSINFGRTTEEHDNESLLDESFKWSQMSAEELQKELRVLREENNLLQEEMFKKTKAHFNAERQHRKEIDEMRSQIKEQNERSIKEAEQDVREYYEKLMNNKKIAYDRKLKEAYEEISLLEDDIRKLRRKYEVASKSEEDSIDVLVSDDEDVFVIE